MIAQDRLFYDGTFAPFGETPSDAAVMQPRFPAVFNATVWSTLGPQVIGQDISLELLGETAIDESLSNTVVFYILSQDVPGDRPNVTGNPVPHLPEVV